MTPSRVLLLLVSLSFVLGRMPARAQSAAAGQAEAQKCEERIAAARRDVLAKYETALQEQQVAVQKAADLEGALAIREEIRRVSTEGALTEKHILLAPKTLRALQQQTLERMQDLVSHLVQETLPKLIELKKSLTIAGRLDDAVIVRQEIERLQDTYLPLVPADDKNVTNAESLITAYAADRVRADKIYKGQRIIVRGIVGGYRVDPTDSRSFHLFLTGGSSGGWVQAQIGPDLRPREERNSRSGSVLAISPTEGETVRIQKGQTFELRAVCDGFDETVRISKCELLR